MEVLSLLDFYFYIYLRREYDHFVVMIAVVGSNGNDDDGDDGRSGGGNCKVIVIVTKFCLVATII